MQPGSTTATIKSGPIREALGKIISVLPSETIRHPSLSRRKEVHLGIIEVRLNSDHKIEYAAILADDSLNPVGMLKKAGFAATETVSIPVEKGGTSFRVALLRFREPQEINAIAKRNPPIIDSEFGSHLLSRERAAKTGRSL